MDHAQATQLLRHARAGDRQAFDWLFAYVYEDLRQLTPRRLERHRRGEPLSATTLVHEIYLRLMGQNGADGTDRAHFFALASHPMRFFLVDHARARLAKHRGSATEVPVNAVQAAADERAADVLSLHKALEVLGRLDEPLGRLAGYRFFGGLSYEEIALVVGCAVPAVKRDWRRARAWLYRAMQDPEAWPSPDRWGQIDRLFAEALGRPTPERGGFVVRASADDALTKEVVALLRSDEEAPLVLGESATAYAEPMLEATVGHGPAGGAGNLPADGDRLLPGTGPDGDGNGRLVQREGQPRRRVAWLAAAALLVVAAGLAMFYSLQLTRERDQARTRAAQAAATTAFLTGLFRGPAADETPGDTLNVFELLERGVRRLTPAEVGDPEVLATVQTTLGHLYLELGDYARAVPLLDSVVGLRRAMHGPEHEEVARALRDAAQGRALAGDYAASDSLYRQALAIQRRRLGPRDRDVAVTLNHLADMLARSGRPDSAEPLYREALGILAATPGDQRREIAASKLGLGLAERRQGLNDRAEPLFRQALELRRALYGNEHIDVAVTLDHLGALYLETGRYDSAEAMLRQSLAIRRKLFGERDGEVAQRLDDLAVAAFEGRKDYASADSLWHQALAIWEGIDGRNHRQVGLVLGRLGQLELDRGDADSALKLFAAGRRVMRAVSGDESTDVAGFDRLVGEALYRRGDLTGALPELERAVELGRKLQGPSHLAVATAELSLAQVVRDRGDYGRADSLYTHALGIWRELGGADDGIAVGLDGHGRLRLLQGRAAEADSMLRESLAIARKHHPDNDERVAQARIDLGAALLAQGRVQEAESLLVQSYLRLSPYERPRGRAILASLFDRLGHREPPAGYRITTSGGQPADTAP